MQQDISKYQVIVNWIKQRIQARELHYGDKLDSENELGQRFGMSRQTVRRALNELMQEGMVESRRGSGTYVVYQPGKKRTPTHNIGVITTYLDTYIFPSIVHGIESVLTQNGYAMQLALTYNKLESERKAISSMLEKGVDGIIIEPTKSGLPSPNLSFYHKALQENIPMILINGYYPDLPAPHVALDDRKAAYMATDYLIHMGHRNIFGIFKLDDYQGRLRYAGYLDALTNAGLEMRDEHVRWFSTEDFESFRTGAECGMGRRIEECTAVLCYNDEIALWVMDLLENRGIEVPQAMSVISIDNSDLAKLCRVALTSVAHPMSQLGSTAAQNLLRMISGEQFDATIDFEPQLVVRDSVQNNKAVHKA